MPLRFSLQRILKNLSSTFRSLITRVRRGPTTQDLTKRTVFHIATVRAFPTWEQWKHFPRLLSAKERWVARGAGLLFALSLLFLIGQFAFLHQAIAPDVGGEYVEGLLGTAQFVNPLYASASDVDMDLTRLVFSGLLKYDPAQGGLVPDLAESYDVSDDGKTYTFTLREGATWHDGNPVRVADVISTFFMIQSAEYKSPLSVLFKEVGIEQVDERTVQFLLDEPFAPFLSTLTIGIMPSHIWENIPPVSAPLAETNLKPIGSGPYQFANFTKDKFGTIRSYTLERNPNFYESPAFIERLTFKFYPDAFSAIDALNNKNIDGVSFIPPDQIEGVTRSRDLDILRPTLQQYTALFFNEVHETALKEIKVRQALTNAVPKEQIVAEALDGFGQIIHSPVLPGMVGYDASVRQSNFDPASSATLLDEAGWKFAEGATLRTKDGTADGTPLTLTMTTLNYAEFVQVAELIKTQWSALGIDVVIETVDAETMQTRILKERAYDILLSGALLGVDPDPYAFWHSSQVDYPGLNVALYADRDVDALIEKGRSSVDEATRADVYKQFQVKIVEDAAAVFLYEPTYPFARSKDVQGDETEHVIGSADRFADVTHWFIKTKRVIE